MRRKRLHYHGAISICALLISLTNLCIGLFGYMVPPVKLIKLVFVTNINRQTNTFFWTTSPNDPISLFDYSVWLAGWSALVLLVYV